MALGVPGIGWGSWVHFAGPIALCEGPRPGLGVLLQQVRVPWNWVGIQRHHMGWMDGGPIVGVGVPWQRGGALWHQVGVPTLVLTGGVRVPWQWVGIPVRTGLTGGVGVPAVTAQESAAEAAAAAEVSGGTTGFPGATKPRRVTSHQPAGQEVLSVHQSPPHQGPAVSPTPWPLTCGELQRPDWHGAGRRGGGGRVRPTRAWNQRLR